MSAESRYFEDFELDPSAYRLRRDGEVVRLERIPFELPCLLIEQRGRVVTREEILERVWGKGVFIDSENSINSAVRKIRRALNDDAEAPRFIVTIPARGYRFVASLREAESSAAKDFLETAPTAAIGTPPEQTSPLLVEECFITRRDGVYRHGHRGRAAFVIAFACSVGVDSDGTETGAATPEHAFDCGAALHQHERLSPAGIF